MVENEIEDLKLKCEQYKNNSDFIKNTMEPLKREMEKAKIIVEAKNEDPLEKKNSAFNFYDHI